MKCLKPNFDKLVCHNLHGGHASPQNVCDENKKEERKNDCHVKKFLVKGRTLYGCTRNPT